MRPLSVVKDTAGDVACEQALCLGEKNREEREGKGGKRLFRFSLSPVPRSTEGLFTDNRRCDLIRCVSTPLWLEVY